MADNEEAQNDVEETISMVEYKKLQRKLTRASNKAAAAQERAESLESGQARVEDMLGDIASLVAEGDEGLSTKAVKLKETIFSRRTADGTAAQLTAKLNQTLDDAGEDWDDDKFDSARKVIKEIGDSGDMSRAPEAERLIREAIEGETDSISDQVEKAVADALLKDRQEHGRVDTRDSASSTSPKVRYSDLSRMDPKEGVGSMRDITKQALDQMFERT